METQEQPSPVSSDHSESTSDVAQSQHPPEIVREIHHHHYDRSGYSLSRILGGGILILLGLGFLADSLGWMEVNVNVWQLWPILIILFGLSILSRKGWISWIISSVVGLLILGLVAWAIVGASSFSTPATETSQVEIPILESVTAVDLAIDSGAGTITMNSGGVLAVSGEYTSNFAELEQTSEIQNGRQDVGLMIHGKWQGWRSPRNDLDLLLNRDLLYNLSIESGATDMDLDLTEISAEKIAIDTGASNLDLRLGDLVSSEVVVDAGASSVTVSLPRTVGVRIRIDAGLSSQEFPELRKEADGVYVSEMYQTAEKNIELQFDLGVSSVTIEWR